MFSITSGKGFHIKFDNGWTVSVQFGGGNYCANYDDNISDNAWRESGKKGGLTVEVAAFDEKHNWHKFKDGDTVSGYNSPQQVLEFINIVAAKEKTS